MDEALKNYVAFAVDAAGVSRATYEFNGRDDTEARTRAENYLAIHDIVELWHGHRRIARLQRTT
ncbi:hypothetical protein JQ615_23165 [Bradyrhizobium jicamae]|uniref:Uncharacterized protein n=1 Tax=Bradyrhizobium jicamae TaxID=280332 RepID=A0ABS5FNB7_9BRAD|nr:hypothetical protein [Bradyrhizobium jicamae]MBR0798290.1 hypothetical protein [Bradyrhizobium jicamae]MBR0938181.1 hypothetical protein [Bradyrhizobium jicamae]